MRTNRTTLAALAALTVTVASCGGSDDGDAVDAAATTARAATTVARPVDAATSTSVAPTSATDAPPPTVPATTSGTTTGWRDDVSAFCTALFDGLAAVTPDDGSAADIVRFVGDLQAGAATLPPFEQISAPPDVQPALDETQAVLSAIDASVARAGEAAAAADLVTARADLRRALADVRRVRGMLALAGAPCDDADPERAHAGALNLSTSGNTFLINAGFGSIWSSQNLDGTVTRLDPVTGEVLATVTVGDAPQKLQAADGRMWVRTDERYVAIDPSTNTVATSLAKADVGPNANRSYALDGAMWICDGRQLHRYDPTTLASVAAVDLDVDCDEVFATDDLVVAYRTNEDDGQSGVAAAAFVDPATNAVLATVPLPVDVAYPAVLDDAVFFPGANGATAVVVDRGSWTVSATPDLGRPTRVGLTATDGRKIYVPVLGYRDVLVVDADGYEVMDTIETLGNAAPVLLDGSLWTADSYDGLIQRHDDIP